MVLYSDTTLAHYLKKESDKLNSEIKSDNLSAAEKMQKAYTKKAYDELKRKVQSGESLE